MSSTNVILLLKAWKMQDLISKFEANGIDEEVFMLLNFEAMLKLIPSIGVSLKLQKHWQDFMALPGEDFASKFREAGILKTTVNKQGQVSDLELIDFEEYLRQAEGAEEIVIHESAVQALQEIQALQELQSQEEAPLPRPVQSNELPQQAGRSEPEPSQPALPERQRVRIGENVTANALKAVLQSTPRGKVVLATYQKLQKLDEQSRYYLVDELIISEVGSSLSVTISTERFKTLSQGIVSLFTTERQETYYVPYKKLPNGKKVTAKGKLFNHYHYLRHLLRQKQSDVASPTPNSSQANSSAGPAVENLSDKLRWLRNSEKPWTRVVEYWKLTSSSRLETLRNQSAAGQPLADYYSEYPVLKTAEGYTLIEIDFMCSYPDADLKFLSEWPDVAPKIVEYCRIRRKKNDAIKDILLEIDQCSGNDDVELLALNLLPQVLNNANAPIGGKGKSAWHPSCQETAECFIYLIPNLKFWKQKPREVGGELDNVISQQKEKHLRFKLTLQPFVVVVGRSLLDIDFAYVVVDGEKYKVDSVIKAVDICFKTFHSLHAEYPAASYAVWLFIQKAIYGIITEWDRDVIVVNSLLSAIQN